MEKNVINGVPQEVCEAFAAVEDFLDKNGYMLAIVKKKNARYTVNIKNRFNEDYVSHDRWYGHTYGKTNVRERRKELGLTQAELANLVGLDQKTISRTEDNRLFHSELSLNKIAEYFKCEIADLLVEQADIELAKKRGKLVYY